MSEDSDTRVAAAAARARAAMAAGATVDDVVRGFRDDDQLDAIAAILALREIAAAPMGLSCAKLIVSEICEGRSYAQLTLADLDLLGDASRVSGVDYFTCRNRDRAIIERKPYLLYVRNRQTNRSVYFYASATPLERQPAHPPIERADQTPGTFEGVCDDVRGSAAAWPTELLIMRDEPDHLLLHFIRAPLEPP